MMKALTILATACILATLASSPTWAEKITDPVVRELLAMDLAALGGVQVYTASRELTSIEEAPSVVSVITAEQIERQGLKSLYEVLARVPGFFNATSPSGNPYPTGVSYRMSVPTTCCWWTATP